MRCFLLLTLFALTLMACGEGRLDLITSDTITDVARCYESVEVVEDAYLVTLDKTCIDLELSGLGGAPVPVETETVYIERDWELIATLQRDVRQRYWHEFHVQADLVAPILEAYADSKDFLFVIENPDRDSIWPIQFYFAQPEEPFDDESEYARTVLYYPCPPRWYEHWGRETNFIGQPIDRSESGFIADLDLGFAGRNFQHEDNRSQDWVGGAVKFGATRDGQWWHQTYAPHIKEGYVLKIYVR